MGIWGYIDALRVPIYNSGMHTYPAAAPPVTPGPARVGQAVRVGIACRLLGVSTSTIARWCNQAHEGRPDVPLYPSDCWRVGTHWRVTIDAIARLRNTTTDVIRIECSQIVTRCRSYAPIAE
jgi:hypothetical protein